jgi:osmoprotectant transport system substrate-binding protein
MMGKMPRQGVRMPRQWRVLSAACLALAVLCAACTGSGSRGSPRASAGRAEATITVGSFDFPESILLAHIYAGALAAKGFRVRVMPDLGTRELVDPALMNGLIQIVPEYTGSALDFLSMGRVDATSDASATYRALTRTAQRRGLVAAQPAPAQDANAIVVTAATAARYHLRSIADLLKVAPRLVFGGPPECQERADCLPGLKRIYGLRFKTFVPTDTGGPLTLQALDADQIGAALLFTTDPGIAERHLVVLQDNRALQPAENITPLIRRSTVERYGPRLLATLNAVSARLTTATLRHLNERAQLHGMNPRTVASGWLRAQALITGRQDVP